VFKQNRRSGFTLIEVLAALAITSVIVMSITALTWNVTRFFDHGTRGVNEADSLVLAVDRLAADFGAARFAQRRTASGPIAAAFIGQAAKVVFVSGAIVSTSPLREEIVVLDVEEASHGARLVRRRAAWAGPRTQLEGIAADDPVDLIEGRVDIEFAFGKIMPDRSLAWQDNWLDESTLPRFVRLSVRDRDTGAYLLDGAEFVVRSNAPPSCVAKASAKCLVPPAVTASHTDQSQGVADNPSQNSGATNQPQGSTDARQ
jgi:prepilin-type N-terminal cleavage/methylation domain-containing protein